MTSVQDPSRNRGMSLPDLTGTRKSSLLFRFLFPPLNLAVENPIGVLWYSSNPGAREAAPSTARLSASDRSRQDRFSLRPEHDPTVAAGGREAGLLFRQDRRVLPDWPEYAAGFPDLPESVPPGVHPEEILFRYPGPDRRQVLLMKVRALRREFPILPELTPRREVLRDSAPHRTGNPHQN